MPPVTGNKRLDGTVSSAFALAMTPYGRDYCSRIAAKSVTPERVKEIADKMNHYLRESGVSNAETIVACDYLATLVRADMLRECLN